MTSRRQSKREHAIALAKAAAKERGHPWSDDDVKVARTWNGYVVYGNRGSRGGQIRVKINRDANTVVSYWIAPR